MAVGDSRLVEHAPEIYQSSDRGRQKVAGSYVIEGKNQVGFKIAARDRAKVLIIDPVLAYSTYLGGSNDVQSNDAMTVDASGNAYVTGSTAATKTSTTAGAFQTSSAGGSDVFVTKLNPTGTALIYSAYLGGSGFDGAASIAIDSAGNAY